MMNPRRLYPWKGHNWTMTQLSKAYGIPYGRLYGRLKTMNMEQALRDLKWDGSLPQRVDWKECPICLRIYRTPANLARHHETMHKGKTV